jgi:hypothetical protein
MHNEGLRLRVLQDQPKGEPGPIRGRFLILDVGNNKHSISLMQFLGVTTDAQELVTVLRRSYPACVSVVNASSLTVEEPLASQELGKEPKPNATGRGSPGAHW